MQESERTSPSSAYDTAPDQGLSRLSSRWRWSNSSSSFFATASSLTPPASHSRQLSDTDPLPPSSNTAVPCHKILVLGDEQCGKTRIIKQIGKWLRLQYLQNTKGSRNERCACSEPWVLSSPAASHSLSRTASVASRDTEDQWLDSELGLTFPVASNDSTLPFHLVHFVERTLLYPVPENDNEKNSNRLDDQKMALEAAFKRFDAVIWIYNVTVSQSYQAMMQAITSTLPVRACCWATQADLLEQPRDYSVPDASILFDQFGLSVRLVDSMTQTGCFTLIDAWQVLWMRIQTPKLQEIANSHDEMNESDTALENPCESSSSHPPLSSATEIQAELTTEKLEEEETELSSESPPSLERVRETYARFSVQFPSTRALLTDDTSSVHSNVVEKPRTTILDALDAVFSATRNYNIQVVRLLILLHGKFVSTEQLLNYFIKVIKTEFDDAVNELNPRLIRFMHALSWWISECWFEDFSMRLEHVLNEFLEQLSLMDVCPAARMLLQRLQGTVLNQKSTDLTDSISIVSSDTLDEVKSNLSSGMRSMKLSYISRKTRAKPTSAAVLERATPKKWWSIKQQIAPSAVGIEGTRLVTSRRPSSRPIKKPNTVLQSDITNLPFLTRSLIYSHSLPESMTVNVALLARGLTAKEHDLLCKVRPREWFWNAMPQVRPNDADCSIAPSVKACIDHFNWLSAWVTTLIVSQTQMSHRVKLLEQFILISYHLSELNNFSSTLAILSGIAALSVHRLKNTWHCLEKQVPFVFNLYQQLVPLLKSSRSYHNYRSALQNASLPCLPHLAVALSDINFIETANGDTLKVNPESEASIGVTLNLKKFQMLADLLEALRGFQRCKFSSHELPDLAIVEAWFACESVMDEDSAYEASLQIEPRM